MEPIHHRHQPRPLEHSAPPLRRGQKRRVEDIRDGSSGETPRHRRRLHPRHTATPHVASHESQAHRQDVGVAARSGLSESAVVPAPDHTPATSAQSATARLPRHEASQTSTSPETGSRRAASDETRSLQGRQTPLARAQTSPETCGRRAVQEETRSLQGPQEAIPDTSPQRHRRFLRPTADGQPRRDS